MTMKKVKFIEKLNPLHQNEKFFAFLLEVQLILPIYSNLCSFFVVLTRSNAHLGFLLQYLHEICSTKNQEKPVHPLKDPTFSVANKIIPINTEKEKEKEIDTNRNINSIIRNQ